MHGSKIVIFALALAGACDDGGGAAKAGGDVKAAAVAKDGGAKAEPAAKDGGAKAEPAAKDEGDAKAEPAADAEPAAGGAFGVAACDDYIAKVEACTTFDRSSKAFTMLTEAWKKGIAAGQADEVAQKCTKAAELFKCPAK